MTVDFKKFHQQITSELSEKYTITIHHYFNGDFGNLDRLEIESATFIGTVDFWSEDWLDIHLVDLTIDIAAINEFLTPEENHLKENALNKFIQILKDTN